MATGYVLGVFAIIIAVIIHVVTGSNALGVMTAAALVEPMLGTLGISPVAAFLACGTGALMFKHANSSQHGCESGNPGRGRRVHGGGADRSHPYLYSVGIAFDLAQRLFGAQAGEF